MPGKNKQKAGRNWKIFGGKKASSSADAAPVTRPADGTAEEEAEDLFGAEQNPSEPVSSEPSDASSRTASGASSEELPEEPEAEPADDRKLTEVMGRSRIIMVIAAIVVLLIVLIFIAFSDRIFNQIEGTASYTLTKTETAVTTPTGSVSVEMCGGELVRCSQDGVQGLNPDGSVAWDQPFNMSSPHMVCAGHYVCVADQLGLSLVILKDGLETTEILTENTILLNTINEIGESAVILNATDGHMVNLYNENGDLLMQRRTYSSKDGIPIAVCLSADGSRMATVYINYTGTELKSIVTVFDLTESGSTLVDRILGSVTFEGSVISDIRFAGSELFFAGTACIGAINAKTNTDLVWQLDLSYRIESLVMSDDFFAVRYGEGLAGTAEKIEKNIVVYNYDGDILSENEFPDATYLDTSNSELIIGQGRSYTAISSAGSVIWTMNAIDDYSRLLIFSTDKQVAALKTGQIDFYEVTLKGTASEGGYE